jgi:hypothetical protein
MVSAAEDFISNLFCAISVTHNNLLAFSDHNATNGSSIMSSSFAAPAEGFDLQSLNSIR